MFNLLTAFSFPHLASTSGSEYDGKLHGVSPVDGGKVHGISLEISGAASPMAIMMDVIITSAPAAAACTSTDHTVSIMVTYGKTSWTLAMVGCAAAVSRWLVIHARPPRATICAASDHTIPIPVAYGKAVWTLVGFRVGFRVATSPTAIMMDVIIA